MSTWVQSIWYFSLSVEMFEAVDPHISGALRGSAGSRFLDLRERHKLCAFEFGVRLSPIVNREKLGTM